MRWFLFIILGFILCLGSTFAQDIPVGAGSLNSGPDWDNSTQADDWSVRAFVGRKLFVEERAKPEYMDFKMPDGSVQTRSLPAFDTRYEARYEILDLIKGPIEEASIDFVAYDHYGRPGFPKVDPVLLFVVSHKSEWVHSKYLYYPIQRTTDGDWAICGKIHVYENEPDEQKKLAASYEEPIGFIDSPNLPDGTVCKTGTRASKIFEFQNMTRFLPRKWRSICNIELGYSPNIYIGTGSHPTAKAQKDAQLHKACVEQKKFEAFN